MTKDSMTRIALLLGTDLGYCRMVMSGVRSYSVGKSWMFRVASPTASAIRQLEQWKPHGIICHLFDPEVAKMVCDLGLPTVNTTSTLDLPLPLIEVDHQMVGNMAARFLMQKKLTNFAYIGSATTGFSREREAGFGKQLAEYGFRAEPCYVEYLPQPLWERWDRIESKVLNWLEKLPKPVGVFASNDIPARDVAEGCHQLAIKVPEEVSILGVDNDEFVCQFARPPLSSIAVPGKRIGMEAARTLDQLMHGQVLASQTQLLPPSHVVERQSSDLIAIDDPLVAEAIGYIRQSFMLPISVSKIAAELNVSRRTIERSFAEKVGRSVLDEIRMVRMARAKELLATTSETVEAIALATGFSSGKRFSTVFRQLNGVSPTEFRASSRR